MAKIGLGCWAGKISLRIARGEVKFKIEDDNGEYKITTDLPGALKSAKISFTNLKEEPDNFRQRHDFCSPRQKVRGCVHLRGKYVYRRN